MADCDCLAAQVRALRIHPLYARNYNFIPGGLLTEAILNLLSIELLETISDILHPSALSDASLVSLRHLFY